MNADLSILLSLYKHTPSLQLAESIYSILQNTVQPREIIIVLDGPVSSGCEKVIKAISNNSRFVIVRLPINIGHAKALNEGLRVCTSSYVLRLDPDDILIDSAIQQHAEAHITHSKADIFNSSLVEVLSSTVYSASSLCFMKPLPQSSSKISALLPFFNTINHPCVSFRLSAIKSVGMYEPYPGFDDYLLWLKALCHGLNFINIPSITLYMRRDSFSSRRHGIDYACCEFNFFISCFKRGLIGFAPLLFSFLRFPLRVIPPSITNLLYRFSRSKLLDTSLPLPWGKSYITSLDKYCQFFQDTSE